MTKRTVSLSTVVVMLITLIVGLSLIFSAPSIGQKEGNKSIRSNGGSMDTSQYEMMVDSATRSFQIGGAILSAIGAVGLFMSGHALYKEL